MYRTVVVIGLGTLGGFLCKHLSEIEEIKELILVDHDIIESKNVFRSIYRSSDVGEYKVDALEDIINNDVTITKLRTRYIEGKTILPRNDLVIDCRDIVCDRTSEIDVRFYISERILMIDCRKNVRNVCDYQGSYRIQLNKSEISKAAFFATQTIFSGQLNEMIKNNMIQRINLDLISSVMDQSIQRSLKNKLDIIYELADDTQRLQCIEENIKPILQLNRASDVDVFVGGKYSYEEKSKPKLKLVPKEAKTKYTLIPKNSLNTSFDVIQRLTDLVKIQPGVSNFIITVVRDQQGKPYIELIEETGAA
ncbi:MAG: ThiF family adenylyltransferase [Candidatus Thorarchaeota archaeon]